MYKTLAQAVLAHGENFPDRLAAAFKDNTVNYGELSRRMKKMAEILRDEYGVERRDRVAISAVSRPDFITAVLAVQYLGGTAVLLDKSAKEQAIKDICNEVQPKVVLMDLKMESIANRVPLKELYEKSADGESNIPYEFPNPDDIGEILFTTGTTGKPKGAMLTYDSLEANMSNTWFGIGMLETDRVLLPLPLNHSFGMRVLRSAVWGGAGVVLQNGFTFAKELETNINKYNCTAMAAVSASIELVRRQMGEQFQNVIGKLRYLEISAGALPVDMRRKLLAELPNTELHNTWGSTETGGALFLNLTKHPDKITSAGKPLEGIDLWVIGEDGNPVQAHNADEAGRMALRGRMQMSGYYAMPELTAQTITDGKLLTNDLIYTDEDGYVYMLGRADDIINVAGEKVSPDEVEQAASEFEFIRECACIGVDDPDGVTGKAPVLYLVPETGYTEVELSKYLTAKLERYKLPKRFVPVEALPRNRMSKTDRKALAVMWSETGDRPLTNDVIRCLMERRSVRIFKPEPIPKTLLNVILQTGIRAPSGHNMQTWQFTVVTDKEKIQHLKAVTEPIAKSRKVHFYGFNEPPVLILVSNDRRNHDGVQDSSCAAENMMLAAHSLGLGSVWINALSSICDVPEVRAELDALQIPPSHSVIATLALGFPDEKPRLLAKKNDVVRWAD